MIYNQEIYRLWYEYLKRSESYQSICDLIEQRHQPPDDILFELFPEAKDISLTPENVVLFDTCCQFATYHRFGDVHRTAFETWWDGGRMHLPIRPGIPITNYDVLKHWVIDFPEWDRMIQVPLFEIDLDAGLTKNMIKVRQIIKTLIDAHKKTQVKEVTSDVLVRYLEVYDIWKANENDRNWTDRVIENNVYYRRQWADSSTRGESIKVQIDRDCHHAKEIIKNIDTGRFPVYRRRKSA